MMLLSAFLSLIKKGTQTCSQRHRCNRKNGHEAAILWFCFVFIRLLSFSKCLNSVLPIVFVLFLNRGFVRAVPCERWCSFSPFNDRRSWTSSIWSCGTKEWAFRWVAVLSVSVPVQSYNNPHFFFHHLILSITMMSTCHGFLNVHIVNMTLNIEWFKYRY